MGESISKSTISESYLVDKLKGFDKTKGYSFTKRNNKKEFDQLTSLLPSGYFNSLMKKLESIDLIYSGSSESPTQVTLLVGRSDRYQGKEVFDVDVFNIVNNQELSGSYLRKQHHHIKDIRGKRVSSEISSKILDEKTRRDKLYNHHLTGSYKYNSLDEYEEDKQKYFDLHKRTVQGD